jgi:hypothetical protein
MTKDVELKVVFAKGSMDDFDGTQEELDALVAEIKEMVVNGAFADAIPITEEEEEEFKLLIAKQRGLQ